MDMIRFEEALNIVAGRVVRLDSEIVDFREAKGRVLASDVHSGVDMPPFDKSAMDGFACRGADLPGPLEVLETIAAGSQPARSVEAGTCSRIMTGAMIPEGADTVIKVEETTTDEAGRVRFTGKAGKPNICYRSEDVHQGQLVLKAGTRISARHIPTLASTGASRVMVSQRPRVGVISTGSELAEPWEGLGPGQIHNSNGHQLMAQAAECGAECTYHGIVDDTEDNTVQIIREALAANDVIILSGGVSMGDFDLVPAMLLKAGLDIRFRQIAIQPGKPTLFAEGGGKYCFALPGNPVSSFVLFEMLVRPFLWSLQGYEERIAPIPALMGKDLKRKSGSRLGVIPVRLDGGRAWPVEYHGSAHIHALADANGFIMVPLGQTEIREGTPIDVRPL